MSIRQQVTLSLLWFSLNFQSAALLPVVVPAQLLLFVAPGAVGNAQQAAALAWLSALGALVALVAQPITGALSDRTRSRLGRRRPYIVAGAALMLAGMAALGIAASFAAFVAGFLMVQVGSNVSTAAYQGLLPDRVPAEQRGEASGYLGLMTILGNVGSLAAAGLLLGDVGTGPGLSNAVRSGAAAYYLAGTVILVTGVAITVAGIREERVEVRAEPRSFSELWIAPWRHDNFRWVFLTRASVMMGLTLFLTFIAYYFADVAHVTHFVQSTAAVAVLALGGALVGALTLGVASDRVGRVGLVSIASGLMTLAAMVFVVAPHVPLWPLGLVFGVGYGAYWSVDWALAVDSLPSLTMAGKDLGVWSIATSLPAVLAPLVGALVIGGGSALGLSLEAGYRAVFALAGIFLLLGAIFVTKVRVMPAGSRIRPDLPAAASPYSPG